MGCGFSCKRFSSTSETHSKTIRIIHSNGYVQYLNHPVMVAHVTGKPAKHLLFTHAELLTHASTPLKQDALLDAGKVYFLLPNTLFNASVSPIDLAPLIKRLAGIAKNSRKTKCMENKQDLGLGGLNQNSERVENCRVLIEMHKVARPKTWKPILSMIREISFNRRSESDVRENQEVDELA